MELPGGKYCAAAFGGFRFSNRYAGLLAVSAFTSKFMNVLRSKSAACPRKIEVLIGFPLPRFGFMNVYVDKNGLPVCGSSGNCTSASKSCDVSTFKRAGLFGSLLSRTICKVLLRLDATNCVVFNTTLS